MELALMIRRLLARRRTLIIGFVASLLAGIFAVYSPSLSGLTARGGLRHSTASTQALIDSRASALADLGQSVTPLQTLASTLANFAPSPTVLDLIGRRAGLQGTQLYAEGPVSQNLPRAVQEPTDLQRNVQIAGEKVPFRLQFNADPNVPVIGISAQAPTTAEAVRLANAAVAGLGDYITQLAASGKIPSARRVVIRQLGQAGGAVDAPSASKALAVLAFAAVFVLWCVLMLCYERFAQVWKETAMPSDHHRTPSAASGMPSAASESAEPRLGRSNGHGAEASVPPLPPLTAGLPHGVATDAEPAARSDVPATASFGDARRSPGSKSGKTKPGRPGRGSGVANADSAPAKNSRA